MRSSTALLLIGLLLYGPACQKEEGTHLRNRILKAIINITEIDDGNPSSYEYTFDYIYKNTLVSEILLDEQKHIELSNEVDKLIAKRYFNNAVTYARLDSFIYDSKDALQFIKGYNQSNKNIWEAEIISNNDILSGYKLDIYYPDPISEETTYNFDGQNILQAFQGTNLEYNYQYSDINNYQDLNFFFNNSDMVNQVGLHAWTLPIVYSKNFIESVKGYFNGEQSFQIDYEHFVENGLYVGFKTMWYDDEGELAKTAQIEFLY
ncbi:MAG: hypothetical protein KJP00_11545 [Bacteroidia bacterium]|nr:hypothetical protein [Bacteroidia bacterium]